MPSAAARPVSGFTLVELSIVLVIIGPLLGGVLIGKDMIRAAQLRSVVTDVQGYLVAAQLFQDKYQCLPGDCTNATRYWSGVTNGNGNGQLEGASAANAAGEMFGVWQELALAGLIKGTFTGLSGPLGVSDCVIGTNVPSAKLSGTGYTWNYIGNQSASAQYFDGNYGNILWFGVENPANNLLQNAALTPTDTYQIDQKMDDGIPGAGAVRERYTNPNCTTGTSSTGTTSTYVTSYSGTACALMFISGW